MSCWADIPFECVAIKCAAQNQTVSGSLVRCITVPAVHGGLLAAGNTLIGICAAPQQVTPLPTAPRTNEAIRPAALKQELGAVRFVRKPLLKCEERVRNGHRPRSCSVGGSESSEIWDNGISLCSKVLNSILLVLKSYKSFIEIQK